MAEVICVGSAVLDHIYDVPDLVAGEATVFARGYHQAGAGSAANAAVATCRLGGKAALWTRLGDDETGDLIVADLVRYGVDVGSVRRIERAQSPISSVLAAANGRRQVTNFDGIGLADDAGWLPLGRLQDTSAVLAESRWEMGAAAALGAARDHRVPGILIIDVTPQPVADTLARSADYVLFSPAGLAQFSGTDDAEAGLAEAERRSGALVGVTTGTDGLRWRADGAAHYEPAPAVDSVDPTAARDVFCGAFALALGEEKPLEVAICFALVAAGLTAAVAGGRRAMPDRGDVWQRLEREYGALVVADA